MREIRKIITPMELPVFIDIYNLYATLRPLCLIWTY